MRQVLLFFFLLLFLLILILQNLYDLTMVMSIVNFNMDAVTPVSQSLSMQPLAIFANAQCKGPNKPSLYALFKPT